jgi:hypothetical protein
MARAMVAVKILPFINGPSYGGDGTKGLSDFDPGFQ